ncbi:MAG: DUF2807 domain-containing protein [Anaerolineales bacterium]|nr:DUF2807 domain-containing protein [Anaerolineales bacterium]
MGGARLKGDIQANNLVVNADGASFVTLTGAAPQIEVNANGASNADLSGLVAANAGVNADGASTISVLVNGVLNVSAKVHLPSITLAMQKSACNLVSEGSTLEQK